MRTSARTARSTPPLLPFPFGMAEASAFAFQLPPPAHFRGSPTPPLLGRCRPSAAKSSPSFRLRCSISSATVRPPPPAAAERVAQLLKRDLPLQYTSPQAMDFSIYDRRLLFTDPMTRLEGKLNYRGMIWTIAFMSRLLFRPSTVSFELAECRVVLRNDEVVYNAKEAGDSGGAYVLTRFTTKGETRWASLGSRPVVISGCDKFHLSSSSQPHILWHESSWDQAPQRVIDSFFRRGAD